MLKSLTPSLEFKVAPFIFKLDSFSLVLSIWNLTAALLTDVNLPPVTLA